MEQTIDFEVKTMKKTMVTTVILMVLLVSMMTACAPGTESTDVPAAEEAQDVQAVESSDDFGAKGALGTAGLTIDNMLRYAIEDEYLARQEYESIMAAFGEQKPFSNIIKAEETHIEMLREIYDSYGYEIPADNAIDHVVLPESIEEALDLGVQAEIDNIAMYEMFLEQKLPDDIRAVFTELRDASQNHLAAFEKGVRGNGK